MIQRWCRQLGAWLIRIGGGRTPILAYADWDVVEHARQLVAMQERRWPDRDSEAKRAQVYMQLLNLYPTLSKRSVSLAIEEAVCLDL